MNDILTVIYNGATSISTPLALAGTIVGLFFWMASRLITALKVAIERITGANAYRLLQQLVRSGFVLALCAVLIAGLGHVYQPIYENFIRQEQLVREGQEQLGQRRASAALSTSQEIIEQWPDSEVGYKIAGSAAFMAADYQTSVKYFQKAMNLVSASAECDENHMSALANLSAALGALGDITLALEHSDRIKDCEMENPQLFNRAKLLLLSGRHDDSAAILSKLVLSRTSPDVRDRAYVTYAALGVVAGSSEDVVLTRLVLANCINSNMKSVFTGLQGQSALPVGFSQDFNFEVQTLMPFFGSIKSEDFNNRLNSLSECIGA